MISLPHLADHHRIRGPPRCKLILAGDQEQLAAVEGGGAMILLADQLGYVQLAEPVRFTAPWERAPACGCATATPPPWTTTTSTAASSGAPPDQLSTRPPAPTSRLPGRPDVLLMAADWARAANSRPAIRDDLIHLGLVSDGPAVRIADGAHASPGDLIICRANDHTLQAGEPGRTLANGDLLRIEAVTRGGLTRPPPARHRPRAPASAA